MSLDDALTFLPPVISAIIFGALELFAGYVSLVCQRLYDAKRMDGGTAMVPRHDHRSNHYDDRSILFC